MISIVVDSKAVRKKLRGGSMALRKAVANKLRTSSKPAIEARYERFAPKLSGRLSRDKRSFVLERTMTFKFIAAAKTINPRTGFNYGLWVTGKIPTITARHPYFPSSVVGKQVRYGELIPGVNFKEGPFWFRGVVSHARRKIPQDVNQAVKKFVGDFNG